MEQVFVPVNYISQVILSSNTDIIAVIVMAFLVMVLDAGSVTKHTRLSKEKVLLCSFGSSDAYLNLKLHSPWI
jgi:hypothetical protein